MFASDTIKTSGFLVSSTFWISTDFLTQNLLPGFQWVILIVLLMFPFIIFLFLPMPLAVVWVFRLTFYPHALREECGYSDGKFLLFLFLFLFLHTSNLGHCKYDLSLRRRRRRKTSSSSSFSFSTNFPVKMDHGSVLCHKCDLVLKLCPTSRYRSLDLLITRLVSLPT